MFRERPVPPGHEELMEVFRQTPYLYGIGKQTGIKGDATYTPLAPPPIPSQQITDVSVILDGDDVQRRGFLYPVTEKQTIPSLGLALALEYLAREGIYPKNAAKQGGLFSLAQTTFYPFRNNTGVYVRADDGSYQILMNWRKAPFKQVSVTEVLDGQISPQIFRERVVIIGGYASKLGDEFLTPFSRGILSTPRKLFGMEAQAQLTGQILSAVLDGRPLVKVWSEFWTCLWIVLWAAIGWGCSHHRRWWQVLTFAFFGTCSLLGLSYTAFLWGWWLSLVPPVLALWLAGLKQF
jgi:CHASE2 domain-containing sensor protein